MPLAQPSILSCVIRSSRAANCRTHQSLCFLVSVPTLPSIVLHPAPSYATTLIFTCLPRYPALNSAPVLSLFSILTSFLPLPRPPNCHYSAICALFFFLHTLGIPLTRPCPRPPLRLTHAYPSPCPYYPLTCPICFPPPARRDLTTPHFPSSRLLLVHKR